MTFGSYGPTRSETILCGRWVDGDGPKDPRRLARFEVDIVWLRQSHTGLALWWDGTRCVDGDGLCHSDNYHFLTSFGRLGPDMAAEWKVTPADRLEVRATVHIFDRAVIACPQDDWSRGVPQWRNAGTYRYGTHEEMDLWEAYDSRTWKEGDWEPSAMKSTGNFQTVEEFVVWSSKRTEAENEAARLDLLARYGAPNVEEAGVDAQGESHEV